MLAQRKEFVRIDDLATYKRPRVKLHAQGIVLRDQVLGGLIKTKTQQVCKVGEFLVAEIDAKVGGFGIVPDELDGSLVSSHYFLFVVDETRLDRRYLDWYSRTPSFQEQVAAQGSTNYAAIRPGHVLSYTIPLPPLPEQRRIVARIEELAGKHDEAVSLSKDVAEQYDALCRSFVINVRDAVATPMAELVDLRSPDVIVEPERDYQFAGVYCFGRGLFRGGTKKGMEFSYRELTRIRAGEFVYPKLMAWEGALAIVPPELDGLYVSPEFPVFSVKTERVLPEVLDVHFRTPSVWPTLGGASTGTNVRRRRLNPRTFLDYRFPLPPMSRQLQLARIVGKADELKRLQAETQKELDALLPSILDRAFRGEL